jgi:DNA polymerase-3 subunit delta'
MPFSEIIGHRRLLALLSRAIAQDTLPQSLLFAGAQGVGKRRTAVALAETINCLEPVATACCRATHVASARRAGASSAAYTLTC